MALCPTRIIVLWKVLLWFYQENLGPYPSEESWCSTTPLCDGGKPISFSAAMAMVFVNFLLRPPNLVIFFAFGGKTKNQQGPKSRNARVFMCFLLIEMVKKGRSLSLYDSFGAWLCGRFMDSRSPRKKRSTQGEAWARLKDFLDDWLVEHVDSLWVGGSWIFRNHLPYCDYIINVIMLTSTVDQHAVWWVYWG